MKTLRVRLTLWFSMGFLVVTAIQMVFTYRHLDLELRRGTFEREDKINPNWILHGSYSEEEVENIMAKLLQSSLTISLPLVLVILLFGYVIARQSLRPIENLNRQLQSVSPCTLGRKVELPEADEQFRSLLGHLNEMLGRLDRSFSEMSEYAAKVAHELRTPITILRHRIEQSQGKIDPELAEDFQEELLRLSHVVEQSLLIAKAEQGRLTWTNTPFDLSALVGETVRDFALLAEAQNRKLKLRAEPGCWGKSDVKHCKQILHALLTNALIHGRGDIHVRLAHCGTGVRFMVANEVRDSARPAELTLGLGLRVVQALVSQQSEMRYHRHHGQRSYAVSLTMPAVTELAVGPATLDELTKQGVVKCAAQ